MKKLTLTENQLAKIIAQVISEQDTTITTGQSKTSEELHVEDVDLIYEKLDYLETRLHELQDDYSRKIGFGDHHVISHDH